MYAVDVHSGGMEELAEYAPAGSREVEAERGEGLLEGLDIEVAAGDLRRQGVGHQRHQVDDGAEPCPCREVEAGAVGGDEGVDALLAGVKA